MTTVREVMTTEIAVVDRHTTPTEAAALMAEYRVGALPILDRGGHVCGMLTDRDVVLNCLADGPGPYFVTGCAEGPPVAVDEQASVEEAAEIMAENGVGRLLAYSGAALSGIVFRVDLAVAMKPGDFGKTMQRLFTEHERQRHAPEPQLAPVTTRQFGARFWNSVTVSRDSEQHVGVTTH